MHYLLAFSMKMPRIWIIIMAMDYHQLNLWMRPMCVCVCVCVCACVYVHVCVYVCVYTHAQIIVFVVFVYHQEYA